VVESQLPKLLVAGSIPVSRSNFRRPDRAAITPHPIHFSHMIGAQPLKEWRWIDAR
jgi:hypothetical protein